MTRSCNNICINFKDAKKTRYKYENGYKRCIPCGIAFKYEGIFCPCCGTRLRGKVRAYGKKSKEVVRY